MKRKPRGRYFYKLLLSFFVIALVPILALSSLTYLLGVVRLRDEISDGQHMLLERASESLHTRIDECADIAYSISMDERVTRLSSKLPVHEMLEGIEQLKRYLVANSFFSGIVVKHGGETNLYTDQGTVDQDVLLKRLYGLNDEDCALFDMYACGETARLVYFPSAGVTMLFQRIPVFATSPTGCCVFVIDGDTLATLLPYRTQEEVSVFLFDEAGRKICVSGDAALTGEDVAVVGTNAGMEQLRLHGTQYTLVWERVAGVGWTFVSMVPESWFNARMRYVLLFGLCTMIAAATLALALLLTQKQYEPIYALSRHSGDASAVRGADELAGISRRLEQTDQLDRQVEEQKQRIKDNLLLRLLQGGPIEMEPIRAALTDMGMWIGRETFSVVLVRLHSHRENVPHAPLLAQIERTLGSDDEAYAVEMASSERVALIVAVDAAPRARLMEAIDALGAWIRQNMLMRASFGVGMPHAFTSISTSYFEASAALDQTSQAGDTCAVFFDEVDTLPQIDAEMQKLEMIYTHALKQGALETALEQLNALLSMLSTRYGGKAMMQYYRFRIAENAIHFVGNENMDKANQDGLYQKLSTLLVSALSAGSMKQYEETMQSATEIICQLEALKSGVQQDDLRANMREFIQRHISDPMLSLDFVTEQFGFSPAYWSNYFREQMELPFQEYVWEIRLRMAKQLLNETDKPVKQVVADVGYIDVSSFIRKFKQHEGVTPGQYRSLDGRTM